MKFYTLTKYLAFCLIVSSSLSGVSRAQIPVVDISSAKNSIQSWFESIKESKFVVSTTNTISKTSAAIGEAKSTISEYVVENKRKIEEKMAKVEKYKKAAEEYKKEYEEYKKQYEDAKAQVEETAEAARQQYETAKSQVEEGVETAKQASAAAQGVVESAKSQVGTVADSVSSELSSAAAKAGVSTQEGNALTTPITAVGAQSGQTVLPEASGSGTQQPRRKTFTTLSPQASLSDIRGQGLIRNKQKLAFAFALELQDNGTDVNGNVIIPQSIAMYPGCDLSSKTAQEEGKMDACLRLINQNSQKARTEDYTDAPVIYQRGKAELAAAVVAEAYKAKNDAEAFEEKILDPIEDAPAPQVLDIYSNVVEVNKAVVNSLNSFLKLQSARLALKSFENYGRYKFLPEEG